MKKSFILVLLLISLTIGMRAADYSHQVFTLTGGSPQSITVGGLNPVTTDGVGNHSLNKTAVSLNRF